MVPWLAAVSISSMPSPTLPWMRLPWMLWWRSAGLVARTRCTRTPLPPQWAMWLPSATLPQVISRFVGFSTYQLDSNLRNSTMVGIVGAGGIGGVLFAAFLRYEYNFVCTILAAVIIIIVIGEIVVNAVRKALNV